jgi:hypothetical protein
MPVGIAVAFSTPVPIAALTCCVVTLGVQPLTAVLTCPMVKLVPLLVELLLKIGPVDEPPGYDALML